MPVARRFIVTGRVQGVWFRDHTQKAARRLGLVGWVRNLPDGSVEARARGEREQLDRLRDALETGSLTSRVDSVSEEPLDPASQDFDSGSFDVRY